MSRQLAPGQTRQLVIVESLTRTEIAQYAGAAGDFNPVHVDEAYATDVAGQPSVFAHGMLTMGLTGRAITELFEIEALQSFGGRFLTQVWPGDSLTVTATVRKVDSGRIELEVETINQLGQPVFRGNARARVPSADSSVGSRQGVGSALSKEA